MPHERHLTCGQQRGRTHNRFWDSYGFVPAVGLAIKVQAPILSCVQRSRTSISEARGLAVQDRNYCNEQGENIIYILTYVLGWCRKYTNTLPIFVLKLFLRAPLLLPFSSD